jgi:hypothetical protein
VPGRATLGACLLLLVGCSSAQVPSADPPASDQAACRDLVKSLPLALDGSENTGRSEFAAAWGDPQIVLRCGTATPAAYQPESQMVVVNDVAWLPQEQERGYLFTAVGRTPQVQVWVPDTHSPEVNPLVDLAETMKAQTQVSGAAGAT